MAKNIIVLEGTNITPETVYYTVPSGKLARIYILWMTYSGSAIVMKITPAASNVTARYFHAIKSQGISSTGSGIQDFLNVYQEHGGNFCENGMVAVANNRLVGANNHSGDYAFMIIEEDLGVQ